MGPSDNGNKTIIYGKITEVNCLMSLGQTRVTYGSRIYAMHSNTGNFPTVYADSLGNYRIELDSLSNSDKIGISFNYSDSYSQANYFISIPIKYSGRKLLLEAKLDTSPIWGGLDCF